MPFPKTVIRRCQIFVRQQNNRCLRFLYELIIQETLNLAQSYLS